MISITVSGGVIFVLTKSMVYLFQLCGLRCKTSLDLQYLKLFTFMSDQELANVQQNKTSGAKRFILVNKDIASVHSSEVLLLSQFVSEDSPLLANLVMLKIDIKSKKCAISFVQVSDRKTTGIKDPVPQLLAACDMFVGKLDLRDFPNNTLQARLLFVQN